MSTAGVILSIVGITVVVTGVGYLSRIAEALEDLRDIQRQRLAVEVARDHPPATVTNLGDRR